VPLFVHSGTAEVLHDEHVGFAKTMRACGTEVEFVESENAPHDVFGAGIILGFVDEAEVAVQKAMAFVEQVTYTP
jgi:acetyl esterase/lipase